MAPSTMTVGGGKILFGYCLDIFLYSVLTVQTYLYYLAFPQDRRITKGIVCFVYIVGTLQTALALHDFHTLFSTLQGRRDLESPSFDVYIFGFMWFTIPAGDALVAFIVQLFYAHRIFVISKARVVTAIVSILAFFQFICGIIISVCIFGPLSKDFFVGDITLAIAAASGALCDLLIAVYTSRYLAIQMKGASRTTQVFVTKVVRLLLETGILTAAMAVAYVTMAFSTPYGIMIPGLSLGKLYANSMLVLLNNRFTIPGGRNVPRPDFDIPSYHHSDLVGASTGSVMARSIAFTHSRPAETTHPGSEIRMARLNPRRGTSTSGTGGDG